MTFCWYFRCCHRTDTRLIISSVTLFKSKQQSLTWFTKRNQWVWTDYSEPVCFKSIFVYVDGQEIWCVPRGRAVRDQRCLWCAEATSVSLTSAGCFCPFLLSPYFDPSASWMPWPPGLPLVSPIDLSSLLSGYTLLRTRAMVQDTSNVPKGLVYPLIPN